MEKTKRGKKKDDQKIFANGEKIKLLDATLKNLVSEKEKYSYLMLGTGSGYS